LFASIDAVWALADGCVKPISTATMSERQANTTIFWRRAKFVNQGWLALRKALVAIMILPFQKPVTHNKFLRNYSNQKGRHSDRKEYNGD
jgi:hypothetical protein